MQNGQGHSSSNHPVQDKYHFYSGAPHNQDMRSRGGRGGQNNPNFNRQNGGQSDANGHHNNLSQGRGRGRGGGRGGGRGAGGVNGNRSDSFSKFRDPHQQPDQNNRLRRDSSRAGDDGGAGGRRNRRPRGPRGDNRRDAQRGGNRNNNWGAPQEPIPNGSFYYEPLGQAQAPEAQPPVLGGLEVPQLPETTMNYIPLATEAPIEPPVIEAKPTVPLVSMKIKMEKKDSEGLKPALQPVKKPAESSDESSSSSSDESVETGEVVKAQALKTKPEAAKALVASAKAPVTSSSSSSSSSEDSDSDSDDSSPPAKSKTAAKEKESSGKTSKKLKKPLSQEDVICLGAPKRHYTIPDEDEESSEVDEDEQHKINKTKSKQKPDNGCAICDKKGHTSFECQMICKNCNQLYHGLKNCPKPPNMNIALQAYLEYTMQQMAVFNVEQQRFAFPAGAVPTMSAAPPSSTPVKSKKEKKTPKKTKKTPQKRMKLETAADDDDDDDDDEEDEDYEVDEEASSESEDSEPSSDEPEPVSKQKRKRNPKQTNPQTAANITPQAFPFPLMAAGSPYSSMMYPYAAPFSFPK